MSLKSLVDLKKKFEEKIKGEGKDAIKKELKDFFQKFPKVKSVRWEQYTPYFNDGEACVFSVHEAKVCLGDEGGCDGDGYYGDWELDEDEKLQKALVALNKSFSAVEEAFQTVFGDGVQVTVRADGNVEIEDYDHD